MSVMISEWIGCDRVGCVIDGQFPLQRWLGGADETGVFLTRMGGSQGQNAAIKIIPAVVADAESLLDQWTAAKRLIHQNLIKLFHAGPCRMDDCDLLYAVTDSADEVLAEVLRVRSLTPAELRVMLDSLLDVLSWLHSQGLVHGGLKPSNVMVVNERINLSVDRVQPAGPRVFPLFSPDIHDAPEAAGKITPAADIWSLGILLVEALTQRPPRWDGVGVAGPRIPASVPPPFAAIAAECLRLDPVRRCTLSDIKLHLAPPPRPVASPVRASRPAAPARPPAIVPAEPPAGDSPKPQAPALPALETPPTFVAPAVAEALAHDFEPPKIPAPPVPEPPPAPPLSVDAPRAAEPAAEEPKPAGLPLSAETSGTNLESSPPVASPLAEAPNPAALPVTTEAPPPDICPAESTVNEVPMPQVAEGTRHAEYMSLRATTTQRTAGIPAPASTRTASNSPANRRATIVSAAMVLVAASLTLTLALRVSNPSSSSVLRSFAAITPLAPGRPVQSAPAAARPIQPVSPTTAIAPPVPITPAPPVKHAAAAQAPAPAVPTQITPAQAAPVITPPAAGAATPHGPTTPGGVLHQVLPDVTQRALDTIRGRLVVIVRVQVDVNGNVSDAAFAYEGNSHYLKTAALAVAQNWKFQPAQIGGKPVPSTWDLQFWFDQTGPSVIAREENQ